MRCFSITAHAWTSKAKYTEVLVRWVQRISAGTPADPRRRQDVNGLLYIEDLARANVLASMLCQTRSLPHLSGETSTNSLPPHDESHRAAKNMVPEYDPDGR
jgi:hypothetical protein